MPKSAGFSSLPVRKVSKGNETETTDALAVEEPLEIRIGFQDGDVRRTRAVSITMRTPGDDFELASGFLFTEGIITSPDQIKDIKHCGPKDTEGETNTVRLDLIDDLEIDLKSLERHFYTTSSCGVCGKSSIEALYTGAKRLSSNSFLLDGRLINSLPKKLRENQEVFERTGGLHASALFVSTGDLVEIREDVGRHNALDKAIGARFLKGQTVLDEMVLVVSGRASFELVQKALMASIPIMLAVGPPSTLAVELAEEFGMTLVGFVRDGGYNVYTGAERVSGER
ncbi:MAG: formate dehydrogenase accessory sulfurtransferase FdhD [Acidobacteria bacterium]|nr:MAG: formate dehydrogenase accessory sulfurtransferase FdhD [Acidobacteriota bacterium]REK02741.1 MAG: formate dehydrogenase accessory sulfurtransferase FdhD [Acidobacteriota bacterium]REK13454.1 MAG: formate dehydrogenase accessory sulfurtransferase FdhD [Acidobacteriota bacterium]REK41448.1 MAG: formate dehydrogenase accessory sulfurtransferase FdhD [Acidobacteriota bacterium]